MDINLIERVRNFLDYDYEPFISTNLEIENAEKDLDVVFDKDYKEFLKTFGGCYVGYCIYGFKNPPDIENVNVIELTTSFRNNAPPGFDNKYVISFDGSDNPILIDNTGKILLFNHDIGSYEILSDSFENFISDNLPD
jgi:hypothetical protein